MAAVLRFAYLPARGLIYWDEGKFALEGIRLESLLLALTGNSAYLLAGKAVGTAKPTHALFLGMAYLLLGIHDYTPAMLNAAASTAGVAATYFIGRRLFGAPVGLFAALLLAISEYDIIYARSALSESDANLLFLVAVAVWLCAAVNSSEGRLSLRLDSVYAVFSASVMFGLAFTVNYRLAVYTGTVFAFDWLWMWWSARQGAEGLSLLFAGRRIGLSVLGFALFPLAWQVIGLIVQPHGIDLFRAELSGQSRSYLQEVVYQLHEGKQSTLHFNPWVYVQWWILRQGWPVSALLGIALIGAMWRRTYAWLLPAALVVVPYCVYVFAPFSVPRNLVASIPFASILCAQLLVSAAFRLRRYRWQAIAVCAVILAPVGASMSWRLTAERSGFALASRYVELHGQGKALTSSEIMVFYLRGSGSSCLAPALPYHVKSLATYYRDGYRYAVIDRHHGSPMVKVIRRENPRVAAFPALGNLSIGESPISSENSNPPSNDTRTEYVDIYRLNIGAIGRSTGAPPCNRDQVT